MRPGQGSRSPTKTITLRLPIGLEHVRSDWHSRVPGPSVTFSRPCGDFLGEEPAGLSPAFLRPAPRPACCL